MIEVNIPDFGEIRIQHLVCDYNGTLACDGMLLADVARCLRELATQVDIHIVTADTFGLAREQLDGLPCTLSILPTAHQDTAKQEYVQRLGARNTVCLGNGRNDRLMLREAVIGIALIQAEGASSATLQYADVVCSSAIDALTLLMQPNRLVATLRS